MATKLYLRVTTLVSDFATGNNDAKLNGSTSDWMSAVLSTVAGSSTNTGYSTSTVAGPTSGVEVVHSITALPCVYYTDPLDADVTVSGSITWNIWAAESAMTSNVAINGQIEVIDGATGTITLIDKTARTTEVAVTTRALNNFSETPAAGIACKRGDRLRVRIFGDDSVDGNMASGGTFNISTDGGTPAADGDTWVQLTENLTFVSEPAGSQVFPTDTASAVSTASVDREAWTSRGAGVQTDVTNTAAGWTAPIQVTDTAGGTVVDWFTKQLAAFTLGGAVRCNIRGLESSTAANASWCVQVARVAGDGTSPTVWAKGGTPQEINSSQTAKSFLISGDDLAISDGQRLRIRLYIDDTNASTAGSNGAMASGQTVTLHYAGTSGGASGDTYLTFTQTLTEYTAAQTVTPTTAALVATKFAPTVTASDHQLVTVPAAGGSTYPTVVLASSPVAYWRMGEASGSVLDSVGSAHGTTTGTVTRDATGLITADDGAISFAASSYVSGTLGAATGNVFSIEMMVKLPASGTTAICPFSTKGASASGISMEVARAGTSTNNFCIKGFIWDGSTYDGVLRSPDLSVAAGGTYHVVWTRAGTTAAQNLVYVNGTDVTNLAVTTQAAVTTDTTFYIGGFEGTAETWNSTLDEVAIYNTALSSGTVSTHYAAVSSAGGLALTTYAPTVTVAVPTIVTPTTQALTLAAFAPTVTASDKQLVTPTTVALVATKFAPTITLTDHQLVTPATKAAILATFAPTVTASDHQSVTPTTKTVTLTTFAPTVTAAAHQQVTPSTTALTLQAFAPSVSTTDHQAVTPTTKALTLATFAPIVSTPQTVTPTAVSLALTAFAPTITNPDPQLVTPTTTALTITKYAPSVGVSDAASIVPPNAALSLTTYAPTVIQPNPQLVTPTTPTLELHTFAPTAATTDHQLVTPTTAALVTARHIPTVAATANQSATPSTKALLLTSYAPQVTVNNIVTTVTIGLTLSTFAPSVTAGTNTYAFPDPASLTLTGYAPLIDLSAFKLVTPATAVLVITTYPPTAEQHSITPLPTPIYGFAIVATGPGAGVGSANGGATVTTSEGGSTAVSSSGPSARVTIR